MATAFPDPEFRPELTALLPMIRQIIKSKIFDDWAVEEIEARVLFKLLALDEDHWSSISDLRAYAATTTYRMCAEWFREHGTQQARQVSDEALAGYQDPQPLPLDRILLSARIEQMCEAIEKLESPYREVVLLRLQDLSLHEIAAKLGRTYEAVKKQLARALVQLQQTLNVDGNRRTP